MNRDVLLQVEGALLERLLQRATEAGAVFAEVRRCGTRRMELAADAASADILLQLCARYGIYARVLRRGGMTALLAQMRRRWTLAPGLLLCLLAVLLPLGRLWWVDVEFIGPAAALGNRTQLEACLRDQDVLPGMPLDRIDEKRLQKQLMAAAEGYSFIGVRRQGVRLLVEAAPEEPSPEVYKRQYARDLVAARDGVVVAVNALSGTACVKTGDTVRAGQTLIRGEEDKTREETRGVAALGEVIARCWYEGGAQGSLTRRVQRRSGRVSTGMQLCLLGLRVPIRACEGFPQEEVELERLPMAGLYLPLELERSLHYETVAVTETLDEPTLRAQLGRLARAQALAALDREDISAAEATSWEECTRQGNEIRVRAVYEVSMNIAVTRDEIKSQSEEDH